MLGLPSHEIVRTELIHFIDDWGKNFDSADYKRIMGSIDNGVLCTYEAPIEFKAVYDAGTILRGCDVRYELKEFEGYEGTDWVVFTLCYPPSSQFGNFLNASKTYIGLDNHLGQIVTAIHDGLEIVVNNHFPPGCMALLAEPKPHSINVSSYPCRDYGETSPFYPDASEEAQ